MASYSLPTSVNIYHYVVEIKQYFTTSKGVGDCPTLSASATCYDVRVTTAVRLFDIVVVRQTSQAAGFSRAAARRRRRDEKQKGKGEGR